MTTPPVADGSPRLRATHADREHVAGLVEQAVADGSLTPEEGAERVQAVRATVHRDEFDALLADLPVAHAAAPPPPAAVPAGRVRSLVARHRTLAWVVAALVVLAVLAGGIALAAGGGHHGGPGDRNGRGGMHQMQDGHRHR